MLFTDTPSPTINNYCTGRKPIMFLKNENIKCIVKLKDLEMFKILKTPQEAPCISVTEKSLNSTTLVRPLIIIKTQYFAWELNLIIILYDMILSLFRTVQPYIAPTGLLLFVMRLNVWIIIRACTNRHVQKLLAQTLHSN